MRSQACDCVRSTLPSILTSPGLGREQRLGMAARMHVGTRANVRMDRHAHKRVCVCYLLRAGIIRQLTHTMGAAVSFSCNIFKVQEIVWQFPGRLSRFHSALSRSRHGVTNLGRHPQHRGCKRWWQTLPTTPSGPSPVFVQPAS